MAFFPRAPQSRPLTDAEIEKLVAPVALYPDPLLAQVLPAATHTDQVRAAAAYLRGRSLTNSFYKNFDSRNYDLSIRSLARYPTVLGLLNQNANWTSGLGYAYATNPADTLNAIQRLRHRAYKLGTLYNNRYNRVVQVGNYLQIIPASPQYIYLPFYDPSVAFVRLPNGVPAIRIVTYSDPYSISAWLMSEINWANQQINYHGWQSQNGWVGASRPYVGDPGWLGGPIVGRPITIRTTITYPVYPVPLPHPRYPRRGQFDRPSSGAVSAPSGGMPRPGAIPMPKPRL